jgi:GT2 family glycosyltransferase
LSLVSVVIPTYNRGYCIARTIDSALNQTHQDIEIIVVDDGSTDDTRDVIKLRYGDDSRIVYVYQANAGVAGARNSGFKSARGQLVALLDSDDVWMPWKLEVQVACLSKFPELIMVWSDMEAMNPDGEIFNSRYIRTMYSNFSMFTMNELFPHKIKLKDVAHFGAQLNAILQDAIFFRGNIFSQMVMGSLVHTSTTLFRRSLLEKIGGFNENLKYSGEDFDFHLRTCREGMVGFLDLATIKYQRGMPDALTRPEYKVHVASNFLKTILPVIQSERAYINLTDNAIKTVLADAYNWLAEAQLHNGDIQSARRSVWTSMRYKLRQPRILTLLLSVYLPTFALNHMRALKQHLKPNHPHP